LWPIESVYKNIIEELKISNSVSLIGRINEQDKAKFFVSANYFIMPNISIQWDCEGHGLVFLEAQYYNLPIIASDTDGIGERVGENDIVLQNENSQEWRRFLKGRFYKENLNKFNLKIPLSSVEECFLFFPFSCFSIV